MNALYAETSAVLRWLLSHPDAPKVEAVLAAAPAVVTSALTTAEVGRTLARLKAGGALSSSQRDLAWADYNAAAALWSTHVINEDVLVRAADPFPVEPIRTLDAIHLATALVYSRAVAPLDMLSTDDRVRDNARALGLNLFP